MADWRKQHPGQSLPASAPAPSSAPAQQQTASSQAAPSKPSRKASGGARSRDGLLNYLLGSGQ